jgi:hypothetical protein
MPSKGGALGDIIHALPKAMNEVNFYPAKGKQFGSRKWGAFEVYFSVQLKPGEGVILCELISVDELWWIDLTSSFMCLTIKGGPSSCSSFDFLKENACFKHVIT